jgi:MbtH protein
MEQDRHTRDNYRVVVNDEQQYSIWPLQKPTPNGWNDAGAQGSEEHCLNYIRSVWTDMRPLSVRLRMADTQ